jgi:hypothetical protein
MLALGMCVVKAVRVGCEDGEIEYRIVEMVLES